MDAKLIGIVIVVAFVVAVAVAGVMHLFGMGGNSTVVAAITAAVTASIASQVAARKHTTKS